MDCEVLYDVERSSIVFEHAPKCIFLVTFALIALLIPKAPKPARIILVLGALLFLGQTLQLWWSRSALWSEYVRRLKSSDCATLEGAVTHFTPMPQSGHGTERLIICGTEFWYSGRSYAPSFSANRYPKGSILKGAIIRVEFIKPETIGEKPEILRLCTPVTAAGAESGRVVVFSR
jgi:hypothetical protein